MSRLPRHWVGILLTSVMAISACGGSGGTKASCGLESGSCRPDSERVDLTPPPFSHPANVVNPLFPSSTLDQVIQLGRGLRVEVTRLPQSKPVEWDGTSVDTVVTQFLSFNGRRITELANDYVAQGDDGSVWYFGESVSNYRKGVVANTGGSWLAGTDGPPGLLMPSHPKPGDVFRSENIPGKVFEEDTILRTDATVDGPRGPVAGAVVVKERLKEAGEVEEKTDGPGYGEMITNAADEHLDLAVAVPIDAAPGPVPPDLAAVSVGAAAVFEAARRGDWTAASSSATSTTDAANRYRAAGGVPPHLDTQLQDAVAALAPAASDRREAPAAQAALDVTFAALDLQLRYRPVADVDVSRMDTWAKQILLDAQAKDADGVASDVAVEEAILARTSHALPPSAEPLLQDAVRQMRRAAGATDVTAASQAAGHLQDVIASARLRP